jgi:hypothetical protein
MPDASAEVDGGLRDLSTNGGDAGPGPVDLSGADLSPRLVHGTVVDDLNVAVAGWKVAIGATTVMTDSSGQFSITAPGGSYDVLVAGVEGASGESPGKTVVAQYLGLTRSDPTLHIGALSLPVANAHTATYSGALSGVPTPIAAGTHGIVGLDSDPASLAHAYFSEGDTTTSFVQIPTTWSGTTPLATTARALFVHDNSDNTETVIGAGKAAVTLNAGADSAVGTLALTMPATQTFSATLTTVPGASSYCETAIYWGTVEEGTGTNFAIPASGAVSFTEPVLDGATLGFNASSAISTPPARYGRVQYLGLQPNATLGSVVVPSHYFSFGTTTGRWAVYTTASAAQFPDASALGIANPKTTDLVGGSIFQYAHPTVDDIAGARPPFVDASVDPGQPFRFAVSTYGQFQFTD